LTLKPTLSPKHNNALEDYVKRQKKRLKIEVLQTKGGRQSGVRGLLIYCSDYKCSHSIAISADQWPDDVRIRSSGTGSAGAGASSTARARLAGVMFSMFAKGAWPGAALKRDVFQMAAARLWEGRW
jgi:hypothetical protein